MAPGGPEGGKKKIYEPVVQEILVYYFVILCFVFSR